jgi:hypothetical protein
MFTEQSAVAFALVEVGAMGVMHAYHAVFNHSQSLKQVLVGSFAVSLFVVRCVMVSIHA